MKITHFLFTALLITLSAKASAIEEIDSIAVVVNDNILSTQEVNNRIKDFKSQMQLQGQALPPEKILRKQIIERMIVDSIQLQLAKAQGIHIDDLSLNQALEGIAQKNNSTLNAMRRKLESSGISFQNYREQIRKDIMIRQLQQRMIYSRIKVSQQEIDIFLDQQKQSGQTANDKYHLAHILIATPEAASPEEISNALKKAKQALDEIKNGKPFNDVALNYSNGQHALKGGDLEWRSAAQLPSLFLDAARRLDKNESSQPLRSASGFHIIKLIDKNTQQHIVSQTNARHILIKADQITTDEQARKQLDNIRKRLVKGEDFAALAAQFSQDPGSKNNGGDLGWATEDTFVPRFTQVMNSLKINQISEPFKSQFGWHIIQVLGRRQQDETDQVIRMKAERAIQNRKADEELQLWLRRARDEAYVDYRLELN